MTDFAHSFGVRYPTLDNVWQALAEGETPDNLPVEWKSINYYAHIFSNDDATVKTPKIAACCMWLPRAPKKNWS